MRKAPTLPPLRTAILLAAVGDVRRHFLLPGMGVPKLSVKKPWKQGNEQREIQDMMRRRR